MSGFSNQTMRQPREAKPNIAYVDGYWRVSPWRRDAAHLYYEAHRWTVKRNRREASVADCHSPLSKYDLNLNRERNELRKQLTKQLRHGLNYGMSAGDLLRNLEAQVAADEETKQ